MERPPGEMNIVGRGAPHAGLVVVHVSPGQRGRTVVNVSLEVSGQRGGAVAEPVPLVHDGVHEPPDGALQPDHGPVLQDGRLHNSLAVDAHFSL